MVWRGCAGIGWNHGFASVGIMVWSVDVRLDFLTKALNSKDFFSSFHFVKIWRLHLIWHGSGFEIWVDWMGLDWTVEAHGTGLVDARHSGNTNRLENG